MRYRRDESFLQAVGLRLQCLRKGAGLNQAELAHRSNLGLETISRAENGKCDVTLTTLFRLAGGLGIDICHLLALLPADSEGVLPKEMGEIGAALVKLDAVALRRMKRMILAYCEEERGPEAANRE